MEYEFWCCQCTRNEIDDVTGINDNNNNNASSLSNDFVVTQQPLPNEENNCSHNDLSFSNNIFETKNGFNERKHELDGDSEMRIEMKRLKEESTNITSIILDNLINESKKVDPAEELTKSEQK
ncbi:unnamed protein product, partial [Cercopithifilaria johnstoni]